VATVVQQAPNPMRSDPWSVRAIIAADRVIYRLAGRWLFVANILALPFAILPVIAPLLRASGGDVIAHPIYDFFSLFCHQQTDRSFHLQGESMACCHRCLGIYVGLVLAGLLFAVIRGRRQHVEPLRPQVAALLAAPLVIDWLLVAAGYWGGTWYLRLSTGLLFAPAIGGVLLPYLDAGFVRMRRDLEVRFDRLVAQGRARPLPGAQAPNP
jgi:uncharacterized membrane protein